MSKLTVPTPDQLLASSLVEDLSMSVATARELRVMLKTRLDNCPASARGNLEVRELRAFHDQLDARILRAEREAEETARELRAIRRNLARS